MKVNRFFTQKCFLIISFLRWILMENCLPSLKWNLFISLLIFPVVTVESISKTDERLRECLHYVSARSLSKLKRNSLICGCWFFTQNALTHWWLMKWLLMGLWYFGWVLKCLIWILFEIWNHFSQSVKNFSDTIPSKWKYYLSIA